MINSFKAATLGNIIVIII